VFLLALEHIQCVTGMLRNKGDDQLIAGCGASGDHNLYDAAVFLLKKVKALFTRTAIFVLLRVAQCRVTRFELIPIVCHVASRNMERHINTDLVNRPYD
jgi:hypothetical protein